MGYDLKHVEAVYDCVAREYANAFSGEHAKKPKDQEILGRFAREVGGQRPIWDFGCGPGQTAAYLRTLGVEISGLDLSEGLLEQARDRHPEIHFQKGNMLDLEFEESSIAGILAFYSIVHFTEKQVTTAFAEVFRVLEPGGLFLLAYHIGGRTIRVDEFLGKRVDVDFVFFPTEFVSSSLRDRGFERIETIEREPYPGVEYESRRAYVFARKPAA